MKKPFGKSSDFSLGAEQVAGNEDLLREIFLRLPARCLIKFKSVSRQWSSVISDPQFARDHSSRSSFRSNTPSGLYFCNSLAKSEDIESVSLEYGPNQASGVWVPSLSFLDTVRRGGTIKILQSCHGLLLCQLTSQSKGSEAIRYCVCNPTTRKYKLVPPPLLRPTESIIAISLAFDPSESFHYRIVCVKHIRPYSSSGGKTHQLDMYSSETGSWKSTACNFRRFDSARFENAFYWNGAIHWVRNEASIGGLFDEFDLNAEKLNIVRFPPKPRTGCNCRWTIRYFGQSRGYWHIIYIRSLAAYQFNVLEMDNDTFRWSVKYRVNVLRILSMFPEVVCKAGPGQYWDADCKEKVYAFSILSFVKGEKEEDTELVLLIPGKVVSFKFRQKTVRVLRELSYDQVVDTSSFGFINSYQFVDTLFSL